MAYIYIYICLYIHKNIRFTVFAQQQRYFNVKLKHMGVSEKKSETYNGI